MSTVNSSDTVDHDTATTERLTLQISDERLRQLQALAGHLAGSPDDVAREFLENEIEAQHGLTFGPHLRRFIYR